MGKVAMLMTPVYFGYLVVVAVVPGEFAATADASFLAACPLVDRQFVCTFPYAGHSDEPERKTGTA